MWRFKYTADEMARRKRSRNLATRLQSNPLRFAPVARVGDRVLGLCADGEFYPATVLSVDSGRINAYEIEWDEGGTDDTAVVKPLIDR